MVSPCVKKCRPFGAEERWAFRIKTHGDMFQIYPYYKPFSLH